MTYSQINMVILLWYLAFQNSPKFSDSYIQTHLGIYGSHTLYIFEL